MNSFTTTGNETFSIIHARRIASRVATDLLRFQSFYGLPSDKSIDAYEEELAILLNYDVVKWVEYGFQRNGKWTEAAVRYTALPGGTLVASDDPGKIRPNLDVAGARFTSFLRSMTSGFRSWRPTARRLTRSFLSLAAPAPSRRWRTATGRKTLTTPPVAEAWGGRRRGGSDDRRQAHHRRPV
jgi:hypothetical protein